MRQHTVFENAIPVITWQSPGESAYYCVRGNGVRIPTHNAAGVNRPEKQTGPDSREYRHAQIRRISYAT